MGAPLGAQVIDLFPLLGCFTHREAPGRLGVSGPGDLLLARRLYWCAVCLYCRQAECKRFNSRIGFGFGKKN
jgi:hypothetical protein